MSYKLAIFDFDGTMVDSLPAIEGLLAQVVKEYELPQALFDQWRQMIGLPLIDQLSVLLADRDEDFRKQVIQRLRVLTDEMSVHSWPLFPGLNSCLEAFAHGGVTMAIVSSKFKHQIVEVLEHHNLTHYFQLVIGDGDVTRHKPDPEAVEKTLAVLNCLKAETIMIGDSIYDVQMARRAQIASIGVSAGIHSAELLYEAGATIVVDALEKIVPIVLAGRIPVA